MFLVLLFSVLSFLGGASANVCTSYFHGQCYDMFSGLNGACSPGHVYTLNYCGVFQMCCYYQTSYHVTSAPLTFAPHVTPAPTAPHTGTFGSAQCGTTLVGSTSQKIVGGSIAQHGEFPWQVSLRYYGQHVCGGTLVGDQWVITAAHCFEELGNYASQWSVAVGVQDRRSIYSNNIVHVSAIYPHEYFDQPTNSNDIAVMRLSKKVDITGRYTRAACLPQQSDTFSADICTVSGWGATRYDPDGKAPITNQLEYVNLRTITNTDCQYYLGYNSVHSTNICAGATSTGGKDACQGDSGGPLVCKRHGVWELAGVVSWGDGCGKARRPGVYTRVTSYLSWVNNKMRLHGEHRGVTCLLFCLVLASQNVQQTNAQPKEQLQISKTKKVWSAIQTLLACFYDIPFQYMDFNFAHILKMSDNLKIATCAVEIGTVLVAKFSEQDRNCLNHKFLLLAEGLLSCIGVPDKIFEMADYHHHSESRTTKTSHERTHEFNKATTKETSYFNTEKKDEHDKEKYFSDSDGETGEGVADFSDKKDRDFLGDQKRSRTADFTDDPVEITAESEKSVNKQDKKKQQESSSCSWLDILEGAGRGLFGGGVGGYIGGGKLGGLIGSGVGTVSGGILGCFYGGYNGGVMGGTTGGAVGGMKGGLKGFFNGTATGAGAAAIPWKELKEKIERLFITMDTTTL